eukprot:TRINITY_DN5502_c0_g1_i13.p2 TRINITY_DN5502_c0_g1~~TRINITY_DN5502_c0_g1_i13.p2  ORF type:complete len:349 (+),score=-41.75 TRINITY_DN5502_c0_g1_i13:651-1697(+)
MYILYIHIHCTYIVLKLTRISQTKKRNFSFIITIFLTFYTYIIVYNKFKDFVDKKVRFLLLLLFFFSPKIMFCSQFKQFVSKKDRFFYYYYCCFFTFYTYIMFYNQSKQFVNRQDRFFFFYCQCFFFSSSLICKIIYCSRYLKISLSLAQKSSQRSYLDAFNIQMLSQQLIYKQGNLNNSLSQDIQTKLEQFFHYLLYLIQLQVLQQICYGQQYTSNFRTNSNKRQKIRYQKQTFFQLIKYLLELGYSFIQRNSNLNIRNLAKKTGLIIKSSQKYYAIQNKRITCIQPQSRFILCKYQKYRCSKQYLQAHPHSTPAPAAPYSYTIQEKRYQLRKEFRGGLDVYFFFYY